MKTIFSRPLFVNPQAYTVIPELYNISKAELVDFNEQNSIDIKIVTSGRVEAKLLKAGKEIILHLDLYTVDGSCVLGEWYLNGISSDSINDILINISNNKINLSYNSMQSSIMSSMVLWYDIAKQGCTNESMKADPTLKDLSGNGHDMTCYNFAWGGMSGIGGYSWDFTNFTNNYTRTASKVVINTDGSVTYNSNVFQKRIEIEPGYVNRGAKVKVTGITGNGSFDFYNGSTVVSVSQDGEYEVDDYASAEGETYMYYGFKRLDGISAGVLVEIELVPDYPGALVSDGVDDYCAVDGLPTLTDYTVVAKREWFDEEINSNSWKCFCALNSNDDVNATFILETKDTSPENFSVQSFGRAIKIELEKEGIVYMTKSSYNGMPILAGNKLGADSLFLFAQKLRNNNIPDRVTRLAFYSFLLFDRTLTDAEIDWVKINLMGAPPTPYAYYDASTETNETIDKTNPILRDLSSHGRDLRLKNFAFDLMSGFGGYTWNFNNFTRSSWPHTATTITIDSANPPETNLERFEHSYAPKADSVQKGAKIKVTGLTNNGRIRLYNYVNTKNTTDYPSINRSQIITEDGIYEVADIEIPFEYDGNLGVCYYGIKEININNNAVVTIELIPYYGKGLVFDGVDDYGIADRDGFDKCTMFLLFKPLINADNISADIRFDKTGDFAIFRHDGDIAYNGRNSNGTYINNVINTKTYCRNLVNKKHLVMIKGNCNKDSRVICLGANSSHTGNFDNMVLYKFLLFDRELTQKEIDKVIDYYGLMDDVDNIEVK